MGVCVCVCVCVLMCVCVCVLMGAPTCGTRSRGRKHSQTGGDEDDGVAQDLRDG